jgi:hypothetical protein
VGLRPIQGGAADAGEYGGDDLLAEGDESGDGAGRVGLDVVAARPAGLVEQSLGSTLTISVTDDGDLGGDVGGHHRRLGQGSSFTASMRTGRRQRAVTVRCRLNTASAALPLQTGQPRSSLSPAPAWPGPGAKWPAGFPHIRTDTARRGWVGRPTIRRSNNRGPTRSLGCRSTTDLAASKVRSVCPASLRIERVRETGLGSRPSCRAGLSISISARRSSPEVAATMSGSHPGDSTPPAAPRRDEGRELPG